MPILWTCLSEKGTATKSEDKSIPIGRSHVMAMAGRQEVGDITEDTAVYGSDQPMRQ